MMMMVMVRLGFCVCVLLKASRWKTHTLPINGQPEPCTLSGERTWPNCVWYCMIWDNFLKESLRWWRVGALNRRGKWMSYEPWSGYNDYDSEGFVLHFGRVYDDYLRASSFSLSLLDENHRKSMSLFLPLSQAFSIASLLLVVHPYSFQGNWFLAIRRRRRGALLVRPIMKETKAIFLSASSLYEPMSEREREAIRI